MLWLSPLDESAPPGDRGNIRKARVYADRVWQPDEMVVRGRGRPPCMGRAVDNEGQVFDVLVQQRPDRMQPGALPLGAG